MISTIDWMYLFSFIGLLIVLSPVLGKYIAWIIQYPQTTRVERGIYRLCGLNASEEMTPSAYAKAWLWLNGWGLLLLFLLQRLQSFFPLNPQHLGAVDWTVALNTAISFVTNTNWQAYSGESTLSNCTQMLGLTTQNFLSAASGMAVLFAMIRGFTRLSGETLYCPRPEIAVVSASKPRDSTIADGSILDNINPSAIVESRELSRSSKPQFPAAGSIGNFWQDCVRIVLYLLLPLSLVWAFLLVGEGVVQTLGAYIKAETLEGASQWLPVGPVASQVAIQQLGTNGGGFFGVNEAHPFANPTPFSNYLETFAILLIPAALTHVFGSMMKAKRQGWLLFVVMMILWLGGFVVSLISEHGGDPFLGTNVLLEGKEVRFGTMESALWSTATTATANGSVNVSMTSLTPLAGGTALVNILLGEVLFGGVGSGMTSMLFFVLLTLFLAGLMSGYSPEYVGKRIEKREMQWVLVGIFGPSAIILIGAALSMLFPQQLAEMLSSGPHALSTVLYTYASNAGNNGSAFSDPLFNNAVYNIVLGIVMLLGRLVFVVASLSLAKQFVGKKSSSGDVKKLSADTLLFGILLVGVIVIVGALTFFPAYSLGPLLEHLLMMRGVG